MADAAPRYLREPPDVRPAIVGCLEHKGAIGDAEVQASLLLLVAEGALEQRESTRRVTTIAGAHDVPTVELRHAPDRWDSLDIVDRELLAFLFDAIGGAGALSLADVQATVHHRPDAFAAGMQRWRLAVVAHAEELGLMRGGRLTDAGKAARDRHDAFRRYLHDFGTLEDEPPVAVALWGPYLAYAVLFGLGDRVARALDPGGPGPAANPNLATWKAWLGLD